MQDSQATENRSRRKIGSRAQQVFGFVGLVLLLTGLVVTGLFGYFTIISSLLCIIGILLGSVVFVPRLSTNIGVYANMLLYSLFFCASVLVFFLILQRHPATFDATQSKRFSLSPITQNFLKRLDQPIRATAFIANKPDRNEAELTLGEYSSFTPQFEYHVYNPFQDADKARQFGVTVLPGDIYLEKLTTDTKKADKVVKVAHLTEEEVTNGIVQLLRGQDLSVYFTQGHGEPALKQDKASQIVTGQRGEPRELEAVISHLSDSYIKTAALELNRHERVPVDASCVVIDAPRTDFSPSDIQLLRNYLEDGGRLLCMLNPDVLQVGSERTSRLTNLAQLLDDYGISLPNEIVIMPLAPQTGDNVYAVPAVTKPHRITQFSDNKSAMRLDQARPVIPEARPPENTFIDTFLVSAPQGWRLPIQELEQALRQRTAPQISPNVKDLKAIDLGAALTRQPLGKPESRATKIVVMGNGDFVLSRFLDQSGWLLFMNSINWLTDSGDLIAIPATKIENTPVILTAGEQQFIFVISVIAIPLLIALGGLGYSISRRGGLQ